MPAAIAIPLVTAGVSAGTQIIGSRMAANASKKAAQTQVDASREAQRSSEAATRQAIDYIEALRNGAGGGYSMSPTASHLSTLLGMPRRSPMLTGTGASPMLQPKPVPMSPMRPVDPYQQLFGMAQQAARTVGGRR